MEDSKTLLCFIIAMGTRKDLFKIYRLFGHVPSNRFVSPGLEDSNFLFEYCFFH